MMHAEVYQRGHLPGLYPLFMRLTPHEMSLEQFSLWFERNARDAEVFMDDRRVVACGYLDHIRPGRWASVHVATAPGLNMIGALVLARRTLRRWFVKYQLLRMVAFVPTWEKTVQAFARACGFNWEKTVQPIAKMVLAREALK